MCDIPGWKPRIQVFLTTRLKLFLFFAEFGNNQSNVQSYENYDLIHNHYEADEKPLLVDVTEESLIGGQTQERVHASTNTSHVILWYNYTPVYLSLETMNSCRLTCAYNNCVFSRDVNTIRQSSAVIFSLTNRIGQYPPLQSSERPAVQVWIFLALESPVYLNSIYRHFRPTWENSFNWSMSYRMDSDIVIPSGNLKYAKLIPQRNYTEIFRNKTKFAAWIVSNCRANSQRAEFVDKM